jgi:putative flippase GtrA
MIEVPNEQTTGSSAQNESKASLSMKLQKLWWQLVRFGLVGGLNTSLDLLIFNGLFWLFPTQNTWVLLAYNSLAYSLGGVNSFILNKYWTFRRSTKVTWSELIRFAITTLLGIACNDLLLWLVGKLFHPMIANPTLWANASKIVAIFGSVLVSYFGMRLWVFVKSTEQV